jgi:hypothetical protein
MCLLRTRMVGFELHGCWTALLAQFAAKQYLRAWAAIGKADAEERVLRDGHSVRRNLGDEHLGVCRNTPDNHQRGRNAQKLQGSKHAHHVCSRLVVHVLMEAPNGA